tara:strand:- start:866 stop:1249 length:384 start_codon:yes stop_codon:yes gene_type:complete
MRKYLELAFISVISIAATIIVLDNKPAVIDGGNAECGCSTEDITNMYENYIEKWKADVKIAFDKAGSEVLKEDNPTPDIIGPDPDPKKCACGGSGWIKQGDGHKTKCPYHGEGMAEIIKEGLLIYRH